MLKEKQRKRTAMAGKRVTINDPRTLHDNEANEFSAITEKVAPVSADLIIIEDSADSNNKKKLQIGNIIQGQGWSLTGNSGLDPASNFLGNTDTIDLVFRTDDLERIRILSNGNVGIGTTSPGNLLHVQKSTDSRIQIESTGVDSLAELIITNDAQDWRVRVQGTLSDALIFRENTGAVGDVMCLLPSGNIGIGTVAPDAALHVSTGNGAVPALDNTTVAVFQRNQVAGADCRVTILAGNTSVSALHFGDAEDEDVGHIAYFHNINSMQFRTNAVCRMTIASTGNVGIGTTTPDTSVHIKANTPGTVGDNPGGQIIIQALGTSINVNAVITGYNSDGSGNPNNQLWYLGSSSSSNQNITLLNRIAASLALGTDGTSRLVIDSVGNITNNNFTKLGSAAPSIKMAKLTGTGGTVEGWTTNVAHGLGDISKIISATVLLTAPNGNLIPPSFTDVAEFQYDFLFTSTNAVVSATATNSGSILSSSPFVILLTLEE